MSTAITNVVALVQQVRRRLYVDAVGRRADTSAPLVDNANENILRYVPWGWCCSELLKLFQQYPSGLTWAIILSELQIRWNDAAPEWRRNTETSCVNRSKIIIFAFKISIVSISDPEQRVEKHIIDAIYEMGSVDPYQVLELTIEKVSLLPNTRKTHIATLTDGFSNRRLEWLIPDKYMSYTEAGNRKNVIRPPSRLVLTACTLLQPMSDNGCLRLITHAAIVVPLKSQGAPGSPVISPMDFFTLFHDPGKTMTAVENEEHHTIRVKVCKAPPRSSSRRSSPVGSKSPAISPRSSQESLGSQRIESRLYFVTTEAELEKTSFVAPAGVTVAFIDFGEQYAPLRAMFKDGDLVAIRYRTTAGNNTIRSCFYDPDNMALFLCHRVKEEETVPMDIEHAEGEIQSSQWRVPKTETGFRDYSHFPEQVRLRHLVGAQAKNFGFLGRVLSMSCHMAKPDSTEVRHVIKMVELNERAAPLPGIVPGSTPVPTPPASSTSATQLTIDILITGDDALQMYSVRPGHLLFFPALITSLHSGPPNSICAKTTSVGVNLCSLKVLMCPGILSHAAADLSSLRSPNPPSHIITKCRIFPSIHPSYLIHRKCGRGPKYLKVFPRQQPSVPILFRAMSVKEAPEIKDTPKQHLQYRCAFCAAVVGARDLDWCFAVDYSVFNIDANVRIDAPIRCSASILANQKVLGCTERDFQTWKFEVQDQVRADWRNLERDGIIATVFITHFIGEEGSAMFRIEDVHLHEPHELGEASVDEDLMDIDQIGQTGYNMDAQASSKTGGFITQQPQTNDDLDAISIEDVQ